jgi:predicted nucleic acid-binding protein
MGRTQAAVRTRALGLDISVASIIVDSSVWIDHYRSRDEALVALLRREDVVMHPYVLAEIALGHMKQREERLSNLRELPTADVARDEEVLNLIEEQQLYGSGLGFVDAHLLASARLTLRTFVFTRDKQLLRVARKLGIAYEEPVRRVQ